MADTENDPLTPVDPPDNNGGGTSPETDSDARATDPPDNNGGGTTAQ
jgi:hypothetical protein